MSWLKLIMTLLPLIVQMLNALNESEECPDGVCTETIAEIKSLQAELESPKVRAGLDLDFLKCLNYTRLFAAIKEIIAVLRDASNGVCPDDDSKKVG